MEVIAVLLDLRQLAAAVVADMRHQVVQLLTLLAVDREAVMALQVLVFMQVL
jgi:hypothetical protein